MATLQIEGMAKTLVLSSTNPIASLLSIPAQRHCGLYSRTDLIPTQHVLVGLESVDPMVKNERQSTMSYITLTQSDFDGSGVGDIVGDSNGDTKSAASDNENSNNAIGKTNFIILLGFLLEFIWIFWFFS